MDLVKDAPLAALPPGAEIDAAVRRVAGRLADNKLLSAVVYAGFVFVKVLAASDWRTSTALGVLNASSLPGVVAAATLSALPSVVLLLLALVVLAGVGGRWRGRWCEPGANVSSGWMRVSVCIRRNRLLVGVTALLAAAVLAVSSWTISAVLLGAAVVCGLVARLEPANLALRGVVGLLFAAVAAVVLYPRVVSSVWLPHQAIEHGTATPTVGYVVDSGSGDVTVLVSRTRELETIPASSVTRSYVCLPTDSGLGGVLPIAHYSVLELLLDQPAPPSCPPTR